MILICVPVPRVRVHFSDLSVAKQSENLLPRWFRLLNRDRRSTRDSRDRSFLRTLGASGSMASPDKKQLARPRTVERCSLKTPRGKEAKRSWIRFRLAAPDVRSATPRAGSRGRCVFPEVPLLPPSARVGRASGEDGDEKSF
jgi:hypothetical protein